MELRYWWCWQNIWLFELLKLYVGYYATVAAAIWCRYANMHIWYNDAYKESSTWWVMDISYSRQFVPRTTRTQDKYRVRVVLGTSCPYPYMIGGGQALWYSVYIGRNQALPNARFRIYDTINRIIFFTDIKEVLGHISRGLHELISKYCQTSVSPMWDSLMRSTHIFSRELSFLCYHARS